MSDYNPHYAETIRLTKSVEEALGRLATLEATAVTADRLAQTSQSLKAHTDRKATETHELIVQMAKTAGESFKNISADIDATTGAAAAAAARAETVAQAQALAASKLLMLMCHFSVHGE